MYRQTVLMDEENADAQRVALRNERRCAFKEGSQVQIFLALEPAMLLTEGPPGWGRSLN